MSDAREVVAYLTPDGRALHVCCSKRPEYAKIGLEPVFSRDDLYTGDEVKSSYQRCQFCGWQLDPAYDRFAEETAKLS